MANDTNLNQDLNSTKTSSSPAHQHLESNTEEISAKSKQEKLDDLGMESARRAENRFGINDQRTPSSTIFSK